MKAKYCVICIACAVLASLLYCAYLRGITPIVNEVVEEVISVVESISEQTTTSNATTKSTD